MLYDVIYGKLFILLEDVFVYLGYDYWGYIVFIIGEEKCFNFCLLGCDC